MSLPMNWTPSVMVAAVTAWVCACPLLRAQDVRVELGNQPLLNSPALAGTQPVPGTSALPPLGSTEASAEFGQQVLISREATWHPWYVQVEAQGYYTDNAALAPREVDDFFLQYGVTASYRNRIHGDWNFEATLQQEFIRYDRFDSLDFDIAKLRTGVSTKVGWLADATFLLRYKLNHLMEAGFGSEIMTSHTIAVGLIKSWRLGGGQRIYLGATSEPDVAVTPDIALRHEHAVVAGWSVPVTEKLTARVTGRAGYHVSPEADRDDWNYLALIGATYQITEWASIGASASMTWNHSSRQRYDYRNLLAGAFLGLEVRF